MQEVEIDRRRAVEQGAAQHICRHPRSLRTEADADEGRRSPVRTSDGPCRRTRPAGVGQSVRQDGADGLCSRRGRAGIVADGVSERIYQRTRMPRHSTTRAGGTSRRTSQPTAMSLWFRWLVTVTLAEALGFLVPAAVGALLVDAPDTTMALAIVAAGLVEGTFLGAGQAAVARRVLPGLPVVRFVALTAVAAAFAYAIAMVPVLSGPRLTDLPWPVVGLLGLLTGDPAVGQHRHRAVVGVAPRAVRRGDVGACHRCGLDRGPAGFPRCGHAVAGARTAARARRSRSGPSPVSSWPRSSPR